MKVFDTTPATETSLKVMVVQLLPDDDPQPDTNSSEDINIDRILTDKIRFKGFDADIYRLTPCS
jgi:hypothetical protein